MQMFYPFQREEIQQKRRRVEQNRMATLRNDQTSEPDLTPLPPTDTIDQVSN